MALIKTVTVSEKGQIAIPFDIREAIGIHKGDELIIVESEGKILLERSQLISKQIKDDFKDILKFSEKSLREVWNNKEDDIWATYLKNGN